MRGDRAAGDLYQLKRECIIRHADSDSREPGGYDVGDERAFGHHDGKRTRPELFGDAEYPGVSFRDKGRHLVKMGNMHNERIERRAFLQFEYVRDGLRVERVRSEPVHGFRGKGNEFALADAVRCVFDITPGVHAGHSVFH